MITDEFPHISCSSAVALATGTRAFQEKIMEQELNKEFKARQILMFKHDRLGGNEYNCTMPFVRKMGAEGTDIRAIKPLDFARNEPTRIVDHGDHWVMRMKRLQKQHYRPETFLFPVRLPDQNKSTRKVADDACNELLEIGVQVLLINETDRIVAFAQSA